MNIDTLHQQLASLGYQFAPPISKDTGVSWYAYKRLEGAAHCTCNDKPPSICVNPYSLAFSGKVHTSVEVELAGELPSGQWVNFKVYSIPWETIMRDLDGCVAVLKAAWNAAVENAK